jgi:hypothetical protein
MNVQHTDRESCEGPAYLRRAVSAAVIVIAAIAAAVGAAVLMSGGTRAVAPLLPSHGARPRAVVDCTPWDLGVIESGEEFAHTFTIRNEGNGPLTLAAGPKLCACTVTNLPKRPIPPGGKAEVRVSFAESVKREPMKHGRFSRGVRVLADDPDNADILLEVTFTVNRRLLALPPDVTLSIDSSKPAAIESRSADILVYSERWERFRLSVARASRPGIQWRLEPAAKDQFSDTAAGGGYRVVVTMPPDLPEGPLAEWIEVAGAPAAAASGRPAPIAAARRASAPPRAKNGEADLRSAGSQEPETLRIPIHGSVHGRLELHSPKLIGANLVLLGTLRQGQAAHETVFVKINDDRRQLSARRIETEPAFLQASFAPYRPGANRIGLYRIDLELPADAPSCAFTAPHRGWIRLRTDHPRLPLIELKVDFCIVAPR